MAQHAILRFEKHKGNPARPLEAHHERQKEQYASNPDIDTSRSKYNFHIVKPVGTLLPRHSEPDRAGRMPDPQGQHTVCRYADNRQPGVFQGEIPKGDTGVLSRGRRLSSLAGWDGKISCRRWYTWTRKTPHLHLTFVPLTKDNRLCAKEIIGNRANLTKWQDDFHAYMVEKYPDLERGESASKTGRKHIPTRLFKQAVSLSRQARAIEAALDGINPLNAGKKKRGSPLHAEKVVPADGELLRATEKVQGHNQ